MSGPLRQSLRMAATRPMAFPYSWLLMLVCVVLDWVLLRIVGFGAGDWSPLWTAGRLAWSNPARLYDFAYVTELQAPILENVGVRPFVYPPTALLLLAPAALLPFRMSFLLLAIGSCAALALATTRDWTTRLLLIASPPVVLAVMTGQPSLLVCALAALGIARLKDREMSAGALLAVAALLKPTLLLLLPVGLIAGRHWRAVAAASVTSAILFALSVLLFGFSPWLDWVQALPRFRDIFDSYPALHRNGITPYALALGMGAASQWITLAILPAVIAAAAFAFRRTDDWRIRFVAIVGGSLLASPYAMHYELAALAPVVATMRRDRPMDLIVPLVWAASLFVNAGLAGLVAVYAWAAFRLGADTAQRVPLLPDPRPCPQH